MIDRDTTIRLAREVGAVSEVIAMGRHSGILFTQLELEHFAALIAALVAAAEREACVTACFQQTSRWTDDRARYAASECAAAIMARGIHEPTARHA